jgi:hypothetical protein
VIGGMLAAGGAARAAGIIIKSGHTQQTSDPIYKYVFDVELLAGSTLQTGGFFTVYDFPELTKGALTSQPNLSWGASVQLTGITPNGAVIDDNPAIYNVTWKWNGAPLSAPPTSNLELGIFIAGVIPDPVSTTLVYVGSLDGINASNQGTIDVTFIPEPSALILLLTSAGALPLLMLRERRRRPAA